MASVATCFCPNGWTGCCATSEHQGRAIIGCARRLNEQAHALSHYSNTRFNRPPMSNLDGGPIKPGDRIVQQISLVKSLNVHSIFGRLNQERDSPRLV
jgi:hypothetical protein